MPFLSLGRRALAVCVLLFISTALASAQEPGTPTQEPIETVFGPGPFVMLSPADGLADLSSYRASLALSFDGLRNGQSEQWTRTWTMLVVQSPPVRQVTVENTADSAATVVYFEKDGAAYEWRGDDDCAVTVADPDNPLAARWEPASFLPAVIGAEYVGRDEVAGAAVDRYAFDELSLIGALGMTDAAGELSTAVDGGYVLRYVLQGVGGVDDFSDGEGTLTWRYELTELNQPIEIMIPERCPAGLVDVPMLADATNVLRLPGLTSYETSSSLADAATFYEQQFAVRGAVPLVAPFMPDAAGILEFTEGERIFSVILTSRDDTNHIDILVGSTLQTSVNVLEPILIDVGGQPVEIPLVPGAADAFSMPEGTGYATTMSVQDVAAFYEQEMRALGAEVAAPFSTFGNFGLVDFTLGGNLIALVITSTDDGSTVFVRIEHASSPVDIIPPVVPQLVTPDATADVCTLEIGMIPIIEGATSLVQMQGIISYSTSAEPAVVLAFYEEQLALFGAELASPPLVMDAMSAAEFSQAGQVISVSILPMGPAASVTIVVQPLSIGGTAPPCAAP